MEPEQFCGACEQHPIGECVVQEGKLGTEIFVIVRGYCALRSKSSERPILLKPGDVFGEQAALRQGGGDDSRNSTISVFALGVVAFDGRLGPNGERSPPSVHDKWSPPVEGDEEDEVATDVSHTEAERTLD
jgi:hypothetical protein